MMSLPSPRFLASLAAAVVVAFARPVAGKAAGPPTAMIAVGLHDLEFSRAAVPGIWQVLCGSTTGVVLKTTQVSVRTVPPAHFAELEEPERSTGGRLIEVSDCANAIVVLRHQGLRDGPVPTVFLGSARLPSELAMELRLGGSVYGLSTKQAGAQAETVEVTFGDGTTRQSIARLDGCCNDNWPSVRWAGDLDRDGKLDLLLELSTHYAGSELTLFLSSAATGSDLVREVARFVSGSC